MFLEFWVWIDTIICFFQNNSLIGIPSVVLVLLILLFVFWLILWLFSKFVSLPLFLAFAVVACLVMFYPQKISTWSDDVADWIQKLTIENNDVVKAGDKIKEVITSPEVGEEVGEEEKVVLMDKAKGGGGEL
jgi:hypothetical protein